MWQISFTLLFALAATVGSTMALLAALRFKKKRDKPALAVLAFWGPVIGFGGAFAALRFAYLWHAPTSTLELIFYVQTTFGALTVVGLAAIIFGAAFERWTSGFLTGIFLMLATIALGFVFGKGVGVAAMDDWSVEFNPVSPIASILVLAVYLAFPVAMAGLLLFECRNADDPTRRRFRLLAAAIVLLYVPNAIKYAEFIQGPLNAAMVALMALGAFLGWRSYVVPTPPIQPKPSGNG